MAESVHPLTGAVHGPSPEDGSTSRRSATQPSQGAGIATWPAEDAGTAGRDIAEPGEGPIGSPTEATQPSTTGSLAEVPGRGTHRRSAQATRCQADSGSTYQPDPRPAPTQHRDIGASARYASAEATEDLMATTTQKGYGSPHQRAREKYARLVASGRARCTEPVCLKANRWIRPDEPWDLAHADGQRGYRGPAHSTCNRSEGSRRRWAAEPSRASRRPTGSSYSIARAE
jgi:hypothetical protein